MIVAGGMADVPGLEPTPMMQADIPSMSQLAGDGYFTTYRPVEEDFETTPESALLSLMGYDLHKGIPKIEELASIGVGRGPLYPEDGNINPIIIPSFSGHGTLISPSPAALGIGLISQLNAMPIILTNHKQMAKEMVDAALTRIKQDEFVMIYVHWPAEAALRGDEEGKKAAIELIDHDIIGPLADYTWNAREIMNLAVTSGFATSWDQQRVIPDEVPVIVYFNDSNNQTAIPISFNELDALRGTFSLPKPQSLMRYLAMSDITSNSNPF